VRQRAVWAGVALVCLTACAKPPEAGSISPTIASTVTVSGAAAVAPAVPPSASVAPADVAKASAVGATSSASAVSTDISVVSPTELTDHEGWLLTAVAGKPVLSASAAVAAAAGEARGEALLGSVPVKVSLATVTDSLTAAGATNIHSPLKHRLVWVVEVDTAKFALSVPAGYTGPDTATGTVQWLIDAVTGKFVGARDFGATVDSESDQASPSG
jgi:hypothetical protein